MTDAMDEMQDISTLPPANEIAHSRKIVERTIADIKKDDYFLYKSMGATNFTWFGVLAEGSGNST